MAASYGSGTSNNDAHQATIMASAGELENFCIGREPFSPECAVRSEAHFCPHTGLCLGPAMCGFSFGRCTLVRVCIQFGECLQELDLFLLSAF
jgi:hypothetical protein